MKVKFWPKDQGIPVSICNHRYNAVMTFSHQTDARYLSTIYYAEQMGFKHNTKLGDFVNNITGPQNDGIADAELTGLMRHDIYYPTEYWMKPGTGTIQVIPDWSATAWTAAGAAVFPVTIGASKLTRYPNHGQQMYDVSGGNYGYDLINGVSGGNNLQEYTGIINYVQSWLKSQTNREVSSGSYRLGITNMAQLQAPRWLGVRNSVPSPSVNNVNGNTFYGNSVSGGKLGLPTSSVFNRQTWNTYPSTSRWWDMWNNDGFSKEQATTYVQDQIALTLANNGWYRDFCHWHAAYNNGTVTSIDEFLGIIKTATGANFINSCSNGEALEYMYLREISNRAIAYELNGAVNLVIDIQDRFKGTSTNGIANDIPLDKINTPLSTIIDLTGTSLAGGNISLNWGKPISLGSNQYLIEIPFLSHAEGFMSMTIKEAISADYHSLTRPTATNGVVSNVLTVTADMPVKAVLFSVITGGAVSDMMPASRSNEFKAVHTFNVPAGSDYKVGIISETGQANLIDV